ncbi:unnamed protein product [marine sediment metagenome]|uniref:Uncharacterized protein n=1 Tax=marine sediment metagenome TaxID=412755 RepID=X0YNU5_9ZZZZ
MPTRKERADAKGSLATDLALAGAAVGSVYGPAGAVVGGVAGGLTGLIVADQGMVLPIDMVAIPAYQAYMITGYPATQIYIKAGETILPTGGNVQDVIQGEVEAMAIDAPMKKKRRKPNAWIKFSRKFEFRKRRKNESAKAYLGARSAAASRAYKKLKKGGTKKGQVRKTARRAYEKK